MYTAPGGEVGTKYRSTKGNVTDTNMLSKAKSVQTRRFEIPCVPDRNTFQSNFDTLFRFPRAMRSARTWRKHAVEYFEDSGDK